MQAVEGAEDDPERAAADLKALHLSEKDTVIGLAASGRTPYVIGGLDYSKATGAHTVSVSCNKMLKAAIMQIFQSKSTSGRKF